MKAVRLLLLKVIQQLMSFQLKVGGQIGRPLPVFTIIILILIGGKCV